MGKVNKRDGDEPLFEVVVVDGRAKNFEFSHVQAPRRESTVACPVGGQLLRLYSNSHAVPPQSFPMPSKAAQTVDDYPSLLWITYVKWRALNAAFSRVIVIVSLQDTSITIGVGMVC